MVAINNGKHKVITWAYDKAINFDSISPLLYIFTNISIKIADISDNKLGITVLHSIKNRSDNFKKKLQYYSTKTILIPKSNVFESIILSEILNKLLKLTAFNKKNLIILKLMK